VLNVKARWYFLAWLLIVMIANPMTTNSKGVLYQTGSFLDVVARIALVMGVWLGTRNVIRWRRNQTSIPSSAANGPSVPSFQDDPAISEIPLSSPDGDEAETTPAPVESAQQATPAVKEDLESESSSADPAIATSFEGSSSHRPSIQATDHPPTALEVRGGVPWVDLVSAATEVLAKVAKRQSMISYKELSSELSRKTGAVPFDFEVAHERSEFGKLLGEVVQNTFERSGHIISSIVIYQHTNEPGPGFYSLAERMRLLRSGASSQERLAFWTGEVSAVHDFYR